VSAAEGIEAGPEKPVRGVSAAEGIEAGPEKPVRGVAAAEGMKASLEKPVIGVSTTADTGADQKLSNRGVPAVKAVVANPGYS
jgi:hypothetical protein